MEDPMRRSLAILPLLALAAACADRAAPLAPDAAAPVLSAAGQDGQYIVVLKEGADPRAVAAVAGVHPRALWTAAIDGFAATLNAGQLNALRHNPNVAYIEADAPARLMTTQWNPPAWGIDRIDQRDLPLSQSYTYGYTGKDVIVYVLDTGIRLKHKEFGGRAAYIPNGLNGNFVGDAHGSAEDCHGHGTHVAGTVGSTTYGVAKEVWIYAGRVVNCSGGGTASMVISGMDWIIRHGKPGVVNMSLGYGDVQSVRDVAGRLWDDGHFVAVAAGNGDFAGTPLNACNESPAGQPKVVTVGSTTSTDQESSFSNYGKCVDILAPGSGIKSAWASSDTATSVRSGTSMATPHVAGVAAQYLDAAPGTAPATVASYILGIATPNRIRLHSLSLANGTPNLLLYTRF
jgi:aqualysin 1